WVYAGDARVVVTPSFLVLACHSVEFVDRRLTPGRKVDDIDTPCVPAGLRDALAHGDRFAIGRPIERTRLAVCALVIELDYFKSTLRRIRIDLPNASARIRIACAEVAPVW